MNEGSECQPGNYEGKIIDMWFEAKKDDDDFMAAHFNVELDNGGTIECGHTITGKYGEMNREIVGKVLGVAGWYDFSEADIREHALGTPVNVKVQHKEKQRGGGVWINAYITFDNQASARIAAGQVQARLARLKEKSDNPF